LRGVEIDAKNIPDIIPVISVAAGAAVGRTTIYNAGRLRIKECDRLEATAEMLTRLGVKVKIDGDTLTIDGNGGLFGGEGSGEASITDGKGGLFSEEKSGEVSTTDGNCGVFSGERSGESASIIDGKAVGNKIILDGYNDHRMVMSSSVAAFACGVPVEIKGAEAVNKSYPNFFEDLEKLTI
jgi:3-phosphoshikimate 1-carboxyvinyltransferase